MNDREFLDYCEAMTETPLCGFVPKNIARLHRLAGDETAAIGWDGMPNSVHTNAHEHIARLVKEARQRMQEERA